MVEIIKIIRWQDVVDILVVALLFYQLISIIRGTRSVQMVLGLVVLVGVYFMARILDLVTLLWLLQTFLGSLFIIIIIVFIPILSLTGIEGKMFKPMAMVFTFALIGTMISGFTYVPVVSSLFIKTSDPSKVDDSRWVHRPVTDWLRLDKRHDPESIEGKIFLHLQKLIRLRKEHEAFSGIDLEVMETDNEHVLAYMRKSDDQRLLIFANFSENEQLISANILRLYGLSYQFTDLISGEKIPLGDVVLNPYQFLCLLA